MTLNKSPIDRTSLSPEMIRLMQAWWRPANFLSVGQMYLLDNPLLDEPLKPEHIKPRLLGHWGTTPGINFIYVHLNRISKEQDVNVLFIAGPGHGAPGIVANTWLEGTYSELYPEVPQDKEGMRRLYRQSLSLVEFQATRLRRRLARSTKAANSAIASRMPMERRSTTLI